jgi:hypothetical protein
MLRQHSRAVREAVTGPGDNRHLAGQFSFSHSLPLSLSGRLDGQRPPSSWNSNS